MTARLVLAPESATEEIPGPGYGPLAGAPEISGSGSREPAGAPMLPGLAAGSAIISPCGLYRVRLERELSDAGMVAAICGVNPSTADALIDDQTIRKDMGFGRRLGWRRIIKVNKFAFRATDVKALRSARDPIGSDNDLHIEQAFREADIAIAAWGPLSKLPDRLRTRWRKVAAIAESVGKPLHCFGTAQDGHPRHTLMLAYDTPLIEWSPPAPRCGSSGT
jgi:hypothetical protein